MKWKLGFAALAATAMIWGDAGAQPTASAPAPDQTEAPAPSPRALELSHRLILAIHITDQLHALLKAMLPAMIDRQAQSIQGFKPEWRQAVTEATVAAMDDIMPAYLKDAERLYAKTFTEDELTQAVAFYESPVGRSLIEKSPSLAPELTKDMMARMNGLEADIKARLCAKLDVCKGAAATVKPTGT